MNYALLEAQSITLWIPVSGKYKLEIEGFTYDKEADCFTCPAGKQSGKGHYMRYLADQQTEKVLLFTCNQQQAEAQAEHTYHSKNKHSQANLDLINAGDIQRRACVAQLSEGINIPNLRVGIIWHAFGNERKAAQRIGRALRLNSDETATVHLLMYQDTVDEQWVAQVLAAFDPAKISYVNATLVTG